MIDTNLQMKIASLQEAITSTHPSLPIILRDIHTLLKNDPATVTLLSEDEIGIIVSGLKKQTATEISASAMKQSSKSLKRPGIADEL